MLLTHSPVADDVLLHLAAPRLACVKPIASVHPEPESNSPLLVFCLFSVYNTRPSSFHYFQALSLRWLLCYYAYCPRSVDLDLIVLGIAWSRTCSRSLHFDCLVMKYIKDRFCNSRKPSPSLGAPAQDPFNLWRANCFFLRVVSAKVRQVFETTKYLEKFFLPIDFCLLKLVLSKLLTSLASKFLS